MRITRMIGAALIAAAVALAPAASARAAAPCAAPVPSDTHPGYTVADPHCDFGTTNPFTPLTDGAGRPISRVYAGILHGAAYRIEVPLHWSGDLAVYAHGYRGMGTTLWVDSSPLRTYQVTHGFAWAASSYQTNGYDVGQGVVDSHAMIALFQQVVRHRAQHVYMTGASMGGHITAVTIEHYRHEFVGALPVCGVLGDAKLFDFYLDFNVLAAAFTGSPITFPLQPSAGFPLQYIQLVQHELPLLGSTFGQGTPPVLTPLGQQWAAAVEQRTGGTRPGFAGAFGYWNSQPAAAPVSILPFHFGLYPGLVGGTMGIANGNVTSNRFTVYQLDSDPRLSRAELALNREVLRVDRTTSPSRDLTGVPLVAGDPRIPVLSMHDIGDLFVPFSMEQVYAQRVLLHGQGGLFVSRAIRGVGHCDFNQTELQSAFRDLVTWVRTGRHPAGDPVLDPRQVARPSFGCRFTVGTHPGFVAPACP
ncbi:MAG TPA: phthalyl amidase [Rugosimonospora sp.]|nr:phthalyl amidase [Rugosimonospora sp.]